jgi:hypothetical protein
MFIVLQNRARDQKYVKYIVKYNLTIFKYVSYSIVNRVLTMFIILRINYIRTFVY